MANRSRFVPLFILSAMITMCPAMVLFGVAVSPTSFGPAKGSLLAIVLILIVLLTILAVSGLWSDLIRGTTEQAHRWRDISVLATIGAGILVGVLAAAIIDGLFF